VNTNYQEEPFYFAHVKGEDSKRTFNGDRGWSTRFVFFTRVPFFRIAV